MSAKRDNLIDAIRSLGLLAIVLYHSGLSEFKNFYLGVDVFFVISGYVIYLSIQRRMIYRNWAKIFILDRQRRLLPPLLCTILFTCIASYWILNPTYLKDLGQSVIFATTQTSNLWFWYEIDYFDSDAYTKPLLHTWSLAVEEQFYVIVFIIGLLGVQFTGRFLPVLLLISFGMGIYIFKADLQLFHYLTPSRIFQFLLGFFIASNKMKSIHKLIFLVLLIFPAFTFEQYNYTASILTAFLIQSNHLLSGYTITKALAWLGRRTYSLYLVHYPAQVLVLLYPGHHTPFSQLSWYVFLTVGFGFILYELVEKRCH